MRLIEILMPPKFYRYLYHKMVIMAMKFGNTEPYSSCVILMAISTFFQLFFILFGIGVIINVNIGILILPTLNNPIYLIVFSLIYGYVHYLFFYYKRKYIKIIEEFKNETPKQTKIGIIYLVIYLFISLFVLIYVGAWFLTFNNPNYS